MLSRKQEELAGVASPQGRVPGHAQSTSCANPLAPISNALRLLRLEQEDQLQRQAGTIIERQVAKLARLVDDLLDVSRITRGRIGCSGSGRRDRHRGRAVESARPLIDQRQHELTVSLPPRTHLVAGRPRPAGAGGRQPAHQRRQVHRRRRKDLADRPSRKATNVCCGCGTRAWASPRKCCPASSTCSRRRNGRWTAPGRVGHRAGAGATAGGNARGQGGGHSVWGKAANSSCVCRWRCPTHRSRRRRPQQPPPTGRPCGCWWWTTTWTRPKLAMLLRARGTTSDGPRRPGRAGGGPRLPARTWCYSTSACRDSTARGGQADPAAPDAQEVRAGRHDRVRAGIGPPGSQAAGFDHHLVKPADFAAAARNPGEREAGVTAPRVRQGVE